MFNYLHDAPLLPLMLFMIAGFTTFIIFVAWRGIRKDSKSRYKRKGANIEK